MGTVSVDKSESNYGEDVPRICGTLMAVVHDPPKGNYYLIHDRFWDSYLEKSERYWRTIEMQLFEYLVPVCYS